MIEIKSTTDAEPVAWMVYTLDGKSVCVTDNPADFTSQHRALPLYTAPPLTIERLRDALVASRIVPPEAVEDPDGYDDSVTLYRIEALHRRLT